MLRRYYEISIKQFDLEFGEHSNTIATEPTNAREKKNSVMLGIYVTLAKLGEFVTKQLVNCFVYDYSTHRRDNHNFSRL